MAPGSDDETVEADTALGDDARSSGSSGPSGPSGPLRRAVFWLLGLDVSLGLLPRMLDLFGVPLARVLDPVSGFLLVLVRFTEVDGLESVVVAVSVAGYSEAMWWLSWTFLAGLTVLYVPRLLRPEDPSWPETSTVRALSVVPFLGAGLLAEAGIRRALAALGEPTTAPFVAPLTVETVGATMLASVALFAVVYLASKGASPRENTFVGYLLRGAVAVVVVGVLLAEFSMLSPLAELYAVGLIAASWNSPLPGDPAERLIQGVASVWEHIAITAMVAVLGAVLAAFGFVLLWLRVSAPAAFAARTGPNFLLLVLMTVGLSTSVFVYCSTMLLSGRRNYDPGAENSYVPNTGLWPVALGTLFLIETYVLTDPLAGIGLIEGTLMVCLILFLGVTVFWRIGGNSIEAGEVSITRRVHSLESGSTLVEFEIESGYESPVEIELSDPLMRWRSHEVSWYRQRDDEKRQVENNSVKMTARVPAGGKRNLHYGIESSRRLGMRTGLYNLSVTVTPVTGGQLPDGSESLSGQTGSQFNTVFPRHHVAAFDAAVFFGLLSVTITGLDGGATALSGVVSTLATTLELPLSGFLGPFGAVLFAYLPLGIVSQQRELTTGSGDGRDDAGGLYPVLFGLSLSGLFYSVLLDVSAGIPLLGIDVVTIGLTALCIVAVVGYSELVRYAMRVLAAVFLQLGHNAAFLLIMPPLFALVIFESAASPPSGNG